MAGIESQERALLALGIVPPTHRGASSGFAVIVTLQSVKSG